MPWSISSLIADLSKKHLNIVPISHEALLLDLSGYGSQDNYLAQLKREMEVQEKLLEFVEPDTSEYEEIKANFDEVLALVFVYDNAVASDGNNNSEVNS